VSGLKAGRSKRAPCPAQEWSIVHLSRLMHPPSESVKLLALFTSMRLDDSGLPPHTVAAGYVGTEAQWTLLEIQWMACLANEHVATFHAKELAHREGEFKDWTDARARCFNRELRKIVDSNTMFSVSCILDDRACEQFRGHVKRKQFRDSNFGHCFRQCIIAACDFMRAELPNERLSIVLEKGHRNTGDACRIFGEYANRPNSPYAECLGAMALAGKTPSLQAADQLAYATCLKAAKGFRHQTKSPKNIRLLCDKAYFQNKLLPAIRAVEASHKLHSERRLKASRLGSWSGPRFERTSGRA
jgi:hypothetical protein